MPGLIAEKVGMTQIFTPEGQWIPVTVLHAGPCQVVQKKLPEKEGYAAVQVGFKEINPKRRSKPYSGHFLKKKLKVYRFSKEFRTTQIENYNPGDLLTVNQFQAGDVVDISGTSKGKGFQGVMKRYHFSGGAATHGCSVSHRSAGSTGQNTYPGRIFKGKKMAGQMGNKQVTMKNLTVVGVEPEEHLLLIKGAVPGGKNAIVSIYPTTGDFEKRLIEGKEKKGQAEETPEPKKEAKPQEKEQVSAKAPTDKKENKADKPGKKEAAKKEAPKKEVKE